MVTLAAGLISAQQAILDGLVLTGGSHQPVPYATVTVLSTDSVVVTGALTDSVGHYRITVVEGRHPFIRVSSLGYQSYIYRLPPVVSGHISLPVIYLVPDTTQMRSITVESTRPQAIVQTGKQVIDAAQFQNAANGTGLDLVKNLASVTVNTEGQIRLRGSDGLIVLLNGKPSNRTPEDILSQLPADQIAKLEVITSGAAMYEADGKAGIINIITKTAVALGWSAAVNTMFGGIYPPQYGGDLTINYNARKWSFYISGDYRRFDYNGYRIGTVRTIYNDTLTYDPSRGIRDFSYDQYAIRAGGTYTPDSHNTVDVGIYYGGKETDRQANLHYLDFYKAANSANLFDPNWSNPQNTYYNQNLWIRKGAFFTTNLSYTHDFKNKSKLTLLGQYEYSILRSILDDQNFTEQSNTMLLYQRSTERSPLNSFRAQTDYSIPLLPYLKLQSGLQFRYVRHNGDFQFLQQDIGTGMWQENPAFSDKLILLQTIESAYIQASGSSKIFSYDIGLRAEYMRRTLTDRLDSLPVRYDKLDFFPTLQGMLHLGKDQKIKLSYDRRIERPTLKLLAPFAIREHAESLEVGDPNVKPEISDLAEITYSKNWKTISITSSLYYKHVMNQIFRVNSIYDRTILSRLFTNAGSSNAEGIDLSANIRVTRWLQFYLSGNVYEYMVLGSYGGIREDSRSLNYNINGNTTIDIIKNLRLQCDLSYLSRTVTAQGWDGDLLLANASLKYSLMNSNLNFAIKLQNIFNSNHQSITTQTPVLYSSTDYIKYDRILTFTIGYTLNEMGKSAKAKSLKTDVGEKDF